MDNHEKPDADERQSLVIATEPKPAGGRFRGNPLRLFLERSKKVKWVVVVSLVLAFIGLGFNIYKMRKDGRREREERHRQEAAERLARRRFRVLVPLFASNQEYLDYMKMESGKRYPVDLFGRKVSGDTAKAINASKSAWLKHFSLTLGASFSEDKVDFYFYPEGDDPDSHERAFVKALAEAEKQKYEVVAIIGHVTSTVTKACGNIYKKLAKEGKTTPLPMILPLATATSLTYSLSLNDGPAVIRLPPANDKQTELISDFLLHNDATKVTIVKDLSNTVYSNDLIDSFHNHFVDEPFRNKSLLDQFKAKHGQTLAIVPVGGESGEPFLHTPVASLKGDALLLFSMTEVALESIAQARASGLTAKYTILTDGAIDEHLIPRANALVLSQGRAGSLAVPESNMLYLTFPLDTPLPETIKIVLSEVPESNTQSEVSDPEDPKNLSMSHAQYVIDAVQILLTVIYKHVIQTGTDRPAKDVITEIFVSWQQKGKIEGMPFFYDPTRIYQIDAFGNATNMKYHLFRAKLPGVVDGDQFDLKNFKWIHDTANCKWERKDEQQAQRGGSARRGR